MNKSKKTPILLVIALIICMGLTAGLTMAFFGGTSTGSSTVTLKTGVKVGATATASNDGAMVVPGQPIDISATGTVEPYSSTGTVVPALLRLKFTIGGAMDVTPTLNTTDAMTIKTEAGDATGYWVLHTDGYYYLCAEAAEATVANTQLLKFTPVNTTTEEDKTKVSLTGNFVVPTSLGNEASNQSLDINARFEVIQAEIYADGSDTAIADANLTIGNEAVQEVFGEFAPEETGPITVEFDENGVAQVSAMANLVTFEVELAPDVNISGGTYLLPVRLLNLQAGKILSVSLDNAEQHISYIESQGYYPSDLSFVEGLHDASLSLEEEYINYKSIYIAEDTAQFDITYVFGGSDLYGTGQGLDEQILMELTFTLVDYVPNVINFADIKNATDSTLTLSYTQAHLETVHERTFGFEIQNIDENCTIQVSFSNIDDSQKDHIDNSDNGWYKCSIKEGFNGEHNQAESGPYDTTFNLTALQNFAFSFYEYSAYNGDAPTFNDTVEITIKIVTE